MRALIAGLLLLGGGFAHAQCVTALPSGTSVMAPTPLPASSLTNSVCIDVPAGVDRLTVRLTATNPSQDVDLLVRVDSPFFDPATESLAALNTGDLFERSHYLSASALGDEQLVITRASKQPLRAGRLHLVLLNFSSAPADFTISSSIGSASDYVPLDVTFEDLGSGDTACDVSGWNDNSARAPIRGNTGTTLGQQRRNAVLEAARLLGEALRPAAAIRVQACWASLPFSASGGVLAQAGPRFVVVDDPGRGLQSPYLDARQVLQFTPIASHLAGTSGCRFRGGSCAAPSPDIRATFNLAVDLASNANQRFDYGLTEPTTFNGTSFVAVALHELSHGMGFIGLIGLGGDNGALGTRQTVFGQQYDDSYGRFAQILADTSMASNAFKPFLRATDEERAAALTSGNALRFAGPQTVLSLNNVFNFNSAPFNGAQLHAPSTVSGGSTYSHLGTIHAQQLMLASATSPAIRSLGLALDMFDDMGYSPAPKAIPTFTLPPDVQYFDIARNGHGIDFRRVAGSTDLYFMVFYTFDANGNPEWFTSLGRVLDGVFVPLENASGDSLLRFDYSAGPPTSSIADASPGFDGAVRVDFVDGKNSPICQQQASQRSLGGPIALMNWTINGETRQWCMQPLINPNPAVSLDVGSVWFNPSDPGWGMSVLSFPGNGGDGIAVLIYYSDAAGKGRWGVVQTDRYSPDQTYPVRQLQGYCREPSCASPAALTFTDIGTMKIDLRPPAEGQSTVTFDITYPGPGGGRFQRTNAPVSAANSPRYRGN